MARPKRSKIGWTDFSGGDANFVIRGPKGDCEISEGCANCYAFTILDTYGNLPPETTSYSDKLDRLWDAEFEENGQPFRRGPGSKPLVFVVDMGDLFHPKVPCDFIHRAFAYMEDRQDVDWQVLTKRVDRMLGFSQHVLEGDWPDNIWAMATIENQRTADERVWQLCQIPAAVRVLSIEPMLEPIDCSKFIYTQCEYCGGHLQEQYIKGVRRCSMPFWGKQYQRQSINGVILGAESGTRRRAFDPDWARPVRDLCVARGVRFFYKQGSHRFPGRNRELDGQIWDQLPDSPMAL